jgi:ATP-dependent DNA helicase RecQ
MKEFLNAHFGEDQDRMLKVKVLLDFLCSFEVASNINIQEKPEIEDGLFFVMHNLIIRGLPTLASWNLEHEFAGKFESLKPFERYGATSFRLENDAAFADILYKAMHIINPAIDRHSSFSEFERSWEDLGSRYEEDFLYKAVPKWIDDNQGDFFIQLLEPQRGLESMVINEKDKTLFEQNFCCVKSINKSFFNNQFVLTDSFAC